MTDNSEIASLIKFTASLMELHEENAFKIKALQMAVYNIEKAEMALSGLSVDQLSAIQGIGKSIAAKIYEIHTTGTSLELQELLARTPPGVIDMLNIKGIGSKKVRTIWKELGIDSKELLLDACHADKISSLKGFGEKTQEAIKQALLYTESNKGLLLYAEAEIIANQLKDLINLSGFVESVEVTGEVRRKLEVIEVLQLIVSSYRPDNLFKYIQSLPMLEANDQACGPYVWRGRLKAPEIAIEVKAFSPRSFGVALYTNSSSAQHLAYRYSDNKNTLQILKQANFSTEKEVFEALNLPFIPPEMREGYFEFAKSIEGDFPRLIEFDDLKGALHNHSKYSDGANTIEEMSLRCMEMGLSYFGIADHSKSGNFYNGGMYEDKVFQQQKEVDALNQKLVPFKIFKGIEVDILNDGSLDYDMEVMATFDYVVASIHSNLKMNMDKATARIIRAIEHPYTTILGHASGRLLLKREGYPLDYKKVIDACAANQVAIEINADPIRLDMDWRHVIYALERGIMISINPDAHDMESLDKMRYGVHIGRKAGLTREMTLNALPMDAIEEYFRKKRSAVTV